MASGTVHLVVVPCRPPRFGQLESRRRTGFLHGERGKVGRGRPLRPLPTPFLIPHMVIWVDQAQTRVVPRFPVPSWTVRRVSGPRLDFLVVTAYLRFQSNHVLSGRSRANVPNQRDAGRGKMSAHSRVGVVGGGFAGSNCTWTAVTRDCLHRIPAPKCRPANAPLLAAWRAQSELWREAPSVKSTITGV